MCIKYFPFNTDHIPKVYGANTDEIYGSVVEWSDEENRYEPTFTLPLPSSPIFIDDLPF